MLGDKKAMECEQWRSDRWGFHLSSAINDSGSARKQNVRLACRNRRVSHLR